MNTLASPWLKWLEPKACWNALVDVWKYVKMASGCLLHEGEEFQAQLRMLYEFITCNPKFATLTINEIKHAFALNYQGCYSEMHRHYNRELNAEFVGSVLNSYLLYRQYLYNHKGEMIKRLIEPAPLVIPPKTEAGDWCRMIQEDYELFRAGESQWINNTTQKYYVLRRANLLNYTNVKKYREWFDNALTRVETDVKIRSANVIGGRIDKERELAIYATYRQTGVIPMDQRMKIFHKMRKMLYLQFFDVISKVGINRIFEDIQHSLRLNINQF